MMILDTSAGTVSVTGDGGLGVAAYSGDVYNSESASAYTLITGDVDIDGEKGTGVALVGGHASNLDATRGTITVNGANSIGVLAMSQQEDGVFNLRTGDINANGDTSFGIAAAALSFGEPVYDDNWNFLGYDYAPSGAINIESLGNVSANGANSAAIAAVSHSPENTSGPVNVTVGQGTSASATGQNSVGVAAASTNGGVEVNIGAGARVLGGWSSDAGDVTDQYWTGDLSEGRASSFRGWSSAGYFGGHTPIYGIPAPSRPIGLPGAGVVVFAGGNDVATINNAGIIQSMNDRAITQGFACASENGPDLSGVVDPTWYVSDSQDPCVLNSQGQMVPEAFGVGDVIVNNTSSGQITGYVDLWDDASHSFNNAGVFVARNFADTDGDGVRDTLGVSRSDFGAVNGTGTGRFTNTGTVQLGAVTGAANVDTSHYYLPGTGVGSRDLDSSFYTLNRDGVQQAQFLNLAEFNQSGVIDLRGSQVGNTLVITGGEDPTQGSGGGVFVANGGVLRLNSVLNAGMPEGGSGGSYSDMLIVDSTRLGTAATSVEVTNVNGLGALTLGNGIELIEVLDASASAAGAFVLRGDFTNAANQAVIMGGAYTYSLYHNGVGTDATDGNWYLRSQYVEPTDPTDPTDPTSPTHPTDPTDPTGPTDPTDPTNPTHPTDPTDPTSPTDPTDPTNPTHPTDPTDPTGPTDPTAPTDPTDPTEPVYQPGVPVVEAYAELLHQMNRLPTLQQRVGNRLWKNPAQAPVVRKVFCKNPATNFECVVTDEQAEYYAATDGSTYGYSGDGAWARIEGAWSSNDPERSATGYTSDTDTYRIQVGVDKQLREYENGVLIGGLYLQYTDASTRVYARDGNGSIDAKGYGIGATLTYYRDDGLYLDGQAQLSKFRSSLYSDVIGEIVSDNDAKGYALSAEIGKRMDISDDWTITPQAQLVYSKASYDDFTQRFAGRDIADFKLKDDDSLRLRLGLSADRERRWTNDEGKTSSTHFYGLANLYYELLDDRATYVSGIALDQKADRAWLGLGVGGTYSWNDDRSSIYGEAAYNSSLRNFGGSDEVTATLGMRIKW